jgi:molecular chaperone GrpE
VAVEEPVPTTPHPDTDGAEATADGHATAVPDQTAHDEGVGTDAPAGEDVPAATSELTACEGRLQRALADLANLRRRFDREVERQRLDERAGVAARLVPIVDNLERALAHIDGDPDALGEGVRAVHAQAVGVLEALGFPRFEDVGRPFDPQRHEAVSTVEGSEVDGGTIVALAWPGYGSGERLLRPAGVVVAAGRR